MPHFFWLAFGTTVLLLIASLWAGITRRRKLHLWVAPASFVFLAITVVLTERLVSSREFSPDDLNFHLKFAYTATGLALPVIMTGLWLARSGSARARTLHRVSVALFLLLVVIATTTGIWAYSLSVPK